MKYWAPYNGISGNINSNDGYADGDPVTGSQGSIPTFRPFEQMQRELVNLVTKSGLTPDAALNGIQIAQALQAGKVLYGVDGGSADDLVVTLDPAPAVYTAGMRFLVRKGANANATATPTLTVNGLATTVIVDRDGAALKLGALVASALLDLAYDGTNFRKMGVLAPELIAAASYVSRQQVFTASGTFTVPPGVTAVQVEVIAGGGGGGASGTGAGGGATGNAGAGGGGGGYSRKSITGLVPGAAIAVTVGGAGIAQGAGNSTAGGASSFGAFCSAIGGGAGAWGDNTSFANGLGGGASGGDLNIAGTTGGFTGPNKLLVSNYNPTDVIRVCFFGGSAAGGMSMTLLNSSGSAGPGYGSGGGGGSGGSNLAGGNGSSGAVIVRW